MALNSIKYLADNIALNSGNTNLIVKFPNQDILFSGETLFESKKPAIFHTIFFHYITLETSEKIRKKLPADIGLEKLEPNHYLIKSENKWIEGNMEFKTIQANTPWLKNSTLILTECKDLVIEKFDSEANFRLLYQNEPIPFIYINQLFNEFRDNKSSFMELVNFENQTLIYNCLVSSSPFPENNQKSKWTKTEFKKLKEVNGSNQYYRIIYTENTIAGIGSPFESRDNFYEINISINLSLKKGVIGIRNCEFA